MLYYRHMAVSFLIRFLLTSQAWNAYAARPRTDQQHVPDCSSLTDAAGPQGRRVVFLGGTFDPPHLGHIAMSKTALTRVDCVWWAPTFHPDYKDTKRSFDIRMGQLKVMLDAGDLGPTDRTDITTAFKDICPDDKCTGIQLVDADDEAIKFLQDKFPNTIFEIVLGADGLTSTKYPFSGWGAKYLKSVATKGGRAIVFGRDGVSSDQLDKAEADLKNTLVPEAQFLNLPALDSHLASMSSSNIREAICQTATPDWAELMKRGLPPSAKKSLENPATWAAYRSTCP